MKLKSYKYRLYPNKQQSVLINKTIGCCRFIYNSILYEKQQNFKNKTNNKIKTEKEYKNINNFLKEVDSIALQQSRKDLEHAYKNYFRKIKNNQKTNLKFKSKKNNKQSYRTININNSIRIENDKIRLPKLGFVNFKNSRNINGKIKSVTVSKNILNEYYISILTEEEIKEKEKLNRKIGIDLGLTYFYTDSNGNKVSNPRNYKKLENKLKKQQKILSRRKKGSNRYLRQRKRVFKTHQKIKNCRKDFLHKLSTKLINENQVICLEDLDVKKMIEKFNLSKNISDVSWSQFVEYLKYKSDWYGRELLFVDKYFASSKVCNNCGNKKEDLKLSDRIYKCNFCEYEEDRDLNAAKNILDKITNRWDNGDSSGKDKTLVLCH